MDVKQHWINHAGTTQLVPSDDALFLPKLHRGLHFVKHRSHAALLFIIIVNSSFTVNIRHWQARHGSKEIQGEVEIYRQIWPRTRYLQKRSFLLLLLLLLFFFFFFLFLYIFKWLQWSVRFGGKRLVDKFWLRTFHGFSCPDALPDL